MRQRSSVGTQTKKSNFEYLFVSREDIDRHMKSAFALVERRAYELFENHGSEHGYDNEDWFQAESEIFHPITIEMGDPGDAYTAFAIISGYRPEDLKINAEPLRLIICGLSCAEGTESNGPQEGSRHDGRFFFSVSLPTAIDIAAVSADIRQDVLEVRLPKAPPRIGPEEP